nr:hypothetical protein [Streptomyces sp. SID7805]
MSVSDPESPKPSGRAAPHGEGKGAGRGPGGLTTDGRGEGPRRMGRTAGDAQHPNGGEKSEPSAGATPTASVRGTPVLPVKPSGPVPGAGVAHGGSAEHGGEHTERPADPPPSRAGRPTPPPPSPTPTPSATKPEPEPSSSPPPSVHASGPSAVSPVYPQMEMDA